MNPNPTNPTDALEPVFVSVTCGGEHCWCGKPAVRKVGEEIPCDDPMPRRHNFTAYICAEHYAQLMGPMGAEQVGIAPRPTITKQPCASDVERLREAAEALLSDVHSRADLFNARCRDLRTALSALSSPIVEEAARPSPTERPIEESVNCFVEDYIPASPTEGGWQQIASAPIGWNDEHEVDLWTTERIPDCRASLSNGKPDWHTVCPEYGWRHINGRPTHWMPIPTPPEPKP